VKQKPNAVRLDKLYVSMAALRGDFFD